MTAVSNGAVGQALSMVTTDVQVELIGRESLTGVSTFADRMQAFRDQSPVAELRIDNVISHGKWCASNGRVRFVGGGIVAFNNLYTFNGHGKNAVL
jgi:hypothetical protein